MEQNNTTPIIYRKLVRDRIPEIITRTGKTPCVSSISGEELRDAIGDKALEEAFELYSEWRRNSREGVLKESADMLEIIKSMLSRSGYTLDDLLEMTETRSRERGAFEKGLFLESVEDPCPGEAPPPTTPEHNTAGKLVQLVKSHLDT